MKSSDSSNRVETVDRRDFLKSASATGLGVMMTSKMPASLLGKSASDKVVVAVIGVNGRGQVHAQNFARSKNTEVAYVCDVDSTVLGKVIKQTQEAQTRAPKAIDDFRRALDDKGVDAVSIATPDHWHAPMALLAMKAGKHVYLEKPCGHNPREGELLVEAQKKYGRVVQMGTQQRSSARTIEALQAIKTARSDTRISCAHGTRTRAPGLGTASPRRFRPISTMSCGKGRRRVLRIATTSCITTGTGSSGGEQARSATTARMKSTSRAWRSASTTPRA